jgi:hypothetical protein
MRREMMILGVFVLSLGAVYVANSVQRVQAAEKKKLLRVGVYDSRGIAIAYGNSAHWSKVLKEKQAALEQAKKDGDTEKVKEIEAWGPAQQAQAHLKAFGTAPVHECFEPVKDRIPEVAQAAGVDVIVSKWECDYLAADAEVVDVTMALAKLFEPSEKAYRSIESLEKWKPYSQEKLQQLEKEHPNF